MEIPIVNANTNMDLYSSKLSNSFGCLFVNKAYDYLNEQYTLQRDVVKSLSLVKDELFKLNLPKELDPNGCDEEVEIDDKLLESIKTFTGLLNYRLIGEYVVFNYDTKLWSQCLSAASNVPSFVKSNEFYESPYFRQSMQNRGIMELDVFFYLDNVINHLYGEDSYVGPYRIKKQVMLGFSEFVHNMSRCTSEKLDRIAETLQDRYNDWFSLFDY